MPLKEIFTVILLIYAGSFLCMIPELIREVEIKRMTEKDWHMQEEINKMTEVAAEERSRQEVRE